MNSLTTKKNLRIIEDRKEIFVGFFFQILNSKKFLGIICDLLILLFFKKLAYFSF